MVALPREFSDHCPLLLKNDTCDFGPIPFKFFNSWLLKKDFDIIVKNSWSNDAIRSNPHPTSNFKSKLQNLKVAIKLWRKELNNLDSINLKKMRLDLDLIDDKAEIGGLSSQDKEERFLLLKKITELDKARLLDLKQKAKVKWVKEGDENSNFFHGMLNHKLSRSRIRGLSFEGVWVTNPQQIKTTIHHFFKNKFKEENISRPSFSSNLFKNLSPEECAALELPFSIQEIKDAVWDCGGDKSLEPDGSLLNFMCKI